LGKTPGKYVGNTGGADQRMTVTVADWNLERYTIEFCFRNERPFDAAPVTGYLFGRQGANVGADADRGEHLGIGGSYNRANTGKLFVFNGDDSPRGSVSGRTPLELNHWYHAVFVRDGGKVSLYLNGQTDQPEFSGELERFATTNNLFLAYRHDGLFPFAGQMRDVALFEGVLSPERIAEHYKASAARAG
jgi:hypothetical protein